MVNTIQLSIVITAYNEEENILPLMNEIEKVFGDNPEVEVIFVNDGSTDETSNEIGKINDPRVKMIELSKNFGQSAAMAAGIDYAKGEYIVTMDGDLQNDPSDISPMLTKLKEENLDLVVGIRTNRKDDFLTRKIPSRIANAIIRTTTKVKMQDYGCTLKVFRCHIAKSLELYGEMHRFIPILASIEGAKIGEMKVKHHSRRFGKSKYGINRTMKVISDLLLMLFRKKYMNKPMHLFGIAGLSLFSIGIIINIYLGVLKLAGNDVWGKPLLMLGFMMIFVGIQFITVGIISELLMRIYYESQKKKHYKVRKVSTASGDEEKPA